MANITNTVEVAVEEEPRIRHGGSSYSAVMVEVINSCTYSREHKINPVLFHTKPLACECAIRPPTSPCSYAMFSSTWEANYSRSWACTKLWQRSITWKHSEALVKMDYYDAVKVCVLEVDTALRF
jgi:hypothetical protein